MRFEVSQKVCESKKDRISHENNFWGTVTSPNSQRKTKNELEKNKFNNDQIFKLRNVFLNKNSTRPNKFLLQELNAPISQFKLKHQWHIPTSLFKHLIVHTSFFSKNNLDSSVFFENFPLPQHYSKQKLKPAQSHSAAGSFHTRHFSRNLSAYRHFPNKLTKIFHIEFLLLILEIISLYRTLFFLLRLSLSCHTPSSRLSHNSVILFKKKTSIDDAKMKLFEKNYSRNKEFKKSYRKKFDKRPFSEYQNFQNITHFKNPSGKAKNKDAQLPFQNLSSQSMSPLQPTSLQENNAFNSNSLTEFINSHHHDKTNAFKTQEVSFYKHNSKLAYSSAFTEKESEIQKQKNIVACSQKDDLKTNSMNKKCYFVLNKNVENFPTINSRGLEDNIEKYESDKNIKNANSNSQQIKNEKTCGIKQNIGRNIFNKKKFAKNKSCEKTTEDKATITKRQEKTTFKSANKKTKVLNEVNINETLIKRHYFVSNDFIVKLVWFILLSCLTAAYEPFYQICSFDQSSSLYQNNDFEYSKLHENSHRSIDEEKVIKLVVDNEMVYLPIYVHLSKLLCTTFQGWLIFNHYKKLNVYCIY